MASASEVRALRHWIANSLQAQATTILLGSQWTTLATFAHRPKLQKMGTTVVIVVSNLRRRTVRVGMGRPSGLKRHEYEISVVLTATSSDDQGGGDDFDQVFDQLDIALEQLSLEAVITDPVSNQQYRVAKIAEEIESVQDEGVLSANQAQVIFTAEKTFPVWVHYND